jgi:hypothetical protein
MLSIKQGFRLWLSAATLAAWSLGELILVSGFRVVAQSPLEAKPSVNGTGSLPWLAPYGYVLLLGRRREPLTAVGFRDRPLRRLQTQQHQFEAVTNELHAIVWKH